MASENNGGEQKSTTVRISTESAAVLLAAKARYEAEVAHLEVSTVKFLDLVVRKGLSALGLGEVAVEESR